MFQTDRTTFEMNSIVLLPAITCLTKSLVDAEKRDRTHYGLNRIVNRSSVSLVGKSIAQKAVCYRVYSK